MISFDGARTLAYSHNHQYFGDNFRYGVVKSLTIEGSIYTLDNEEGVAPVWSGISGLTHSGHDYDSIVLNGVDFGKGRLESLNFEVGTDVNKKNYTANITIFSSGNLFNLGGEYYSGLSLNTGVSPIYLTENFSEDFSFELNDSKQWEFSHNLQIKFVSGAAKGTSESPISMAKLLASQLFSATFPLQIFNSSLSSEYNSTGRQTYTESYDEISNECSFSRNIKLGKETGDYLITYTNSINIDENGVTTVSEQGEIEGLKEPRIGSALSGYTTELLNFFPRASGLFYAYKSGDYDLINTALNTSKTINRFEGRVGYGISYTNDTRINNGYSWEYTQDISRASNCIYTLSENGSIKGISQECSQVDLYSNAVSAWASIKSGISGRMSGFYYSSTSLNNPLRNISASENKSAFRGSIDYNYTYNDDPYSNVSGFKKVTYSVDDSYPVHLVSKFTIPGVKEIVQPQNNSTVGNRTVTLEINGDRNKILTEYLDYAKTKLNELAPTGGDVFINECQYSLNKTNNVFNIQCGWSFFDYRPFTSNEV